MSDNTFRRAQLIAAYKRVFLNTGADGKAVLEDLAAEGMLDSSTFDPNPSISAYKQGSRDYCLGIFEKLNVNIADYLSQNVIMEDV